MRKVIGMMVMVLFTVSFIAAQVTPIVVADEIETNDPLYYNHASHVARSSDGDLVAVWTSAADQIVYSVYDEAFVEWSAAVNISNAGYNAHKAGVTADGLGNIFCVWQQRDSSAQNYAIYYAKFDGVNWTTPKDLSGVEMENEEAAIAVSSNNELFVAWNTDGESDSSEFILCVSSTDQGETWSTADTLGLNSGTIGGGSTTSGRPFLNSAPNGKMLCTWHEEPVDHGYREPFVNQFDGTSWLDEPIGFIDVPDSANSMYATVGATSDGTVYLIYTSFTSPEKLLMVKKSWDDDAFGAVVDTLVAADNEVRKPFLVVDANDNMYLGIRADDVEADEMVALMTSSDKGLNWSAPLRLSREGYDAGYISLGQQPDAEGVDILWRESAHMGQDDDDTTAVVYAHAGMQPTAVDGDMALAAAFSLKQNYPNPFNPTTEIVFSIVENGRYDLSVYNVLGNKIRTILASNLTAGSYTCYWDGKDATGLTVSSGVYFYRLSGVQQSTTKKMILMR